MYFMYLEKHNSRQQVSFGFTIVELLIVIVVVGVLASIVVVAYRGVQDRASSSSIVNGIKATEKALKLFGSDQGITTWWGDSTLTGTANPTIDSLIVGTGLGAYLKSVPSSNNNLTWQYDFDNDTYSGCSTASTVVNINIGNVDKQSVAQGVDDALDDGNITCGKVRYSTTTQTLRYSLSANGVFN